MPYNSNVIQVQSKFKIFKYFFIIELTHLIPFKGLSLYSTGTWRHIIRDYLACLSTMKK